MRPDRVIVRKIREYDPDLSVTWNDRSQYFELWLSRPFWLGGGKTLITPVTQSIYDNSQPKEFVELDERIVWWIYWADSHRWGGSRQLSLDEDKRWVEFQRKLDRNKKDNYKNMGKDIWQHANAFYPSNHKVSKNKPTWETQKESQKWIDPSSQMRGRFYSRSKRNALAYGYGR